MEGKEETNQTKEKTQMINLALIIVVLFISILHSERGLTLIFALPVAIFPFYSESLGDNSMYLIAGVSSYLASIFIKKQTVVSKLKKELLWACFGLILINLFGLGIYHLGMEPTAYNWALSLFYMAVIIILTRGWKHVGYNRSHSDHLGASGHAYQSILHSDKHK